MKKIKIFLITMVVIALAIIFMPIGASAHTLSYDANGGTGTMDSIQVTGSKCLTNTNNFTAPEGKAFAGWSFTKNALKNDIITNCFNVEEDTTVYAVWLTAINEVIVTGTEIRAGYTIPSTVNIATDPEGANSDDSMNVVWYESDTGTENILDVLHSLTPVTGEFKEGKYYYFNNSSIVSFKNEFYPSNNIKYTYNGTKFLSLNNNDIVVKWIKAESPIIKELSITGVEEPVFGERANQSTLPVVTLTPNIKNATEGGWFKAESSFDKNHTLTLDYIKDNAKKVKITSNIDKNPIYEEGIYILVLGTKTEYDFILDNNFKSMINGKEVSYELKNNHLIYQYYVVEVKEYSYKYISGDNQEFIKGKINNYAFTIDGDYSKVESLTVGNISLTKDTDFTVTKGSAIINFTKEGLTKLNKLNVGTYIVETKFSDELVTGKLIINEENPNTKDNILSNIILSSISLISLISISLCLSKNKKYN